MLTSLTKNNRIVELRIRMKKKIINEYESRILVEMYAVYIWIGRLIMSIIQFDY